MTLLAGQQKSPMEFEAASLGGFLFPCGAIKLFDLVIGMDRVVGAE
jgi:hypothetical protein